MTTGYTRFAPNHRTRESTHKESEFAVDCGDRRAHERGRRTGCAAVQLVLGDVVKAVDGIVEDSKSGGRLFYTGTGTSGRLGVLDASECPPTFGVSPDLVQGVIAGGYDACYRAVEASEDDATCRVEVDLEATRIREQRCAWLESRRRVELLIPSGAVVMRDHLGAFTVGAHLCSGFADHSSGGVEYRSGCWTRSSDRVERLKAGTAQKMVLNMISTATMVRLGYVSGNRMSNLQARNIKLRDRAVRILARRN